MKKFLSILLAGIMLACMIPTVAFAEDAPSGIFVGETQYSSIDAAAAAAYNTTSKEITISGTVAVNGRQTIAYDGVKLIGINNATLIPSANYANGSATNRKALFTITANNVIVNDVSFDGSVYGNTLNQGDDFVVIRVNSGTGIQFRGVTATGSKKTVLSVGTTSSTASVSASNFTCNGFYKNLPTTSIFSANNVYPDIDINSGSTFALSSGTINGFVGVESNATFNYPANQFYRFRYFAGAQMRQVYTSARYLVSAYIDGQNNSNINEDDLVTLLTTSTNLSTVQSMVENTLAETPRDIDFIRDLKSMIDAAIAKIVLNTGVKSSLQELSGQLADALPQS